MSSLPVYDLLIIYEANQISKTVYGVSDYGTNNDGNYFWYVKNGYRSFVPMNVVRFFGRKFDYETN